MSRDVTPEECALLVLHYLRADFPGAAAAFAREAAPLLSRLDEPAGPVKPLRAILSDFLALSEAKQRRAAFERSYGDNDPVVRRTLSRLANLLEDYEGATSRAAPAAAAAASSGAGAASGSGAASGAGGAPSGAGGPGASPHRRRKASQPRHRDAASSAASSAGTHSRQLFGRAATAAAGGAAAAAAAPPFGNVELGQRIAERINDGGGANGGMSVDQVVETLLRDTHTYDAFCGGDEQRPAKAARHGTG